MNLEVKWLLFLEEFNDVWIFTELKSLAGSNDVIVVNDFFSLISKFVDSIEEFWELFVSREHFINLVILGVVHDSLAKFTDVVVLCKVGVNFLC